MLHLLPRPCIGFSLLDFLLSIQPWPPFFNPESLLEETKNKQESIQAKTLLPLSRFQPAAMLSSPFLFKLFHSIETFPLNVSCSPMMLPILGGGWTVMSWMEMDELACGSCCCSRNVMGSCELPSILLKVSLLLYFQQPP
ncbi:hypothetical protein LR48_Vigan09g058700 [Vigna angularis]|uniref:Uncharacterized protein n=1 Tax=Phaseolus angularis TaxID=3914 RepID=A0A0L9VA90_PHAAN|nr:hypothetical protein LR48_Vigan09g058700 [Vigna angularis]